MDQILCLETETLTKVLKILGLESDELKPHLCFPQPKVQNLIEEFKILILVRGIVDKFLSKPRKTKKLVFNTKPNNELHNQLSLISSTHFSDTHRNTQLTTQGNNFYVILHETCKKEQIYLNIPDTILFSQAYEPIKLWTNAQGLVQSRIFHILDLKSELLNFKKPLVAGFASFVLCCEHHTSKKMLFQTYFYESGQIEDLLYKIQEVSYLKTPYTVCSFVKFKGNLPAKTRAVFIKSSAKAYFIGTKERIKEKVKNEYCWVTRFMPSKLIDSLQFSKQEQELFEAGFRCKVIFPIRTKSVYFEKELFELEFVKFAEKVLLFIRLIVKSAIKLQSFQKFKEKLSFFLDYIGSKLLKVEKFSQKFVGNEPKIVMSGKKQWEASQFIKLSESSCSLYQITNNKKTSILHLIYSEVKKIIKVSTHNSLQIVGGVIDFIESNEGIFIIKVLKVDFEEKKVCRLPVISSTKHISLFSATEGSGFVKGKMNRQRLCCGDYCSLLKRNDFETKEKIEFLMKHYLQYANTLFELLKLQDLLNIDTINHLINHKKRPTTPITQHMQYKVLRKVILEDRYDKYSLRSLILNLPNEVVRELNLILESGNENSIELHLSPTSSTTGIINKKLTWEFELVPVCDKCYKIYSKRMNN